MEFIPWKSHKIPWFPYEKWWFSTVDFPVFFHRGPSPESSAEAEPPSAEANAEDAKASLRRREVNSVASWDMLFYDMWHQYDIDIWHRYMTSIWHQYEIYEIYEICWFMTSIWLESVIAVTEKRLDFGWYFGQRFFWLGVTATGIDSKYLKILQYEI